jgi:hypothetical protein
VKGLFIDSKMVELTQEESHLIVSHSVITCFKF